MDSAEFDRLIAYEKKRQKSPAEVYETLDPERQQLPYLRSRIAESRTSRDGTVKANSNTCPERQRVRRAHLILFSFYTAKTLEKAAKTSSTWLP